MCCYVLVRFSLSNYSFNWCHIYNHFDVKDTIFFQSSIETQNYNFEKVKMTTLQVGNFPPSTQKDKYRLTTEYHIFQFFDEDEIAEFSDSDDDSSQEDDETYFISSTQICVPSKIAMGHNDYITVNQEEKSRSFRSPLIDTRNENEENSECKKLNYTEKITNDIETNERRRLPSQRRICLSVQMFHQYSGRLNK